MLQMWTFFSSLLPSCSVTLPWSPDFSVEPASCGSCWSLCEAAWCGRYAQHRAWLYTSCRAFQAVPVVGPLTSCLPDEQETKHFQLKTKKIKIVIYKINKLAHSKLEKEINKLTLQNHTVKYRTICKFLQCILQNVNFVFHNAFNQRYHASAWEVT